MNSVLSSAIQQAASSLRIDRKLAERIYMSYWKFIRESLSSYGPMEDMTREEFASLSANFNVPYIGKLYTDYEKIVKYKRKQKFYKDVKVKENQASGEPGACH